jgi:hypothetical protein
MAATSSTFPSIPSQVAFRFADRPRPGLTTVGYERPIADHVVPEVLGRAIGRLYHRHEALHTTLVEAPTDLDPSSPEYLWHGLRNIVAERPIVSFEVTGPSPDGVGFGRTEGRPPPDAGEPSWLPGVRADPGRLPVFRFLLLDGGPNRILRMVTDHSLCDRWSLFALQPDIERAYRQELAGAPASPQAPPFSSYAKNLYSLWTSGAFTESLVSIETKVASLDMGPLPDTGERPPASGLIRSFVVSLSTDSTRRFEAIRARLKASRLTVAIALFSRAVGAEFGWRHLALLLPRANRSSKEVGSLGLFADAQYVFASVATGVDALVRRLSADLEEARIRMPPPAALAQASPAIRDILRAMPRLAADVLIRPRPGGSRRNAGSEVFVRAESREPTGHDEDTIAFSCPPSFPGQPHLRLLCSFGPRHQFSVNFHVDRVPRSAARSIAERLLREVRESPPDGR